MQRIWVHVACAWGFLALLEPQERALRAPKRGQPHPKHGRCLTERADRKWAPPLWWCVLLAAAGATSSSLCEADADDVGEVKGDNQWKGAASKTRMLLAAAL
jgi:hypothetical protein